MVLGETASPTSSTAKSKHTASSSHRKSSSHVSATATVPAGTGRNSTGAGKPSVSATSAETMDQSGLGVAKAKNVCVVEPQSSSKATAVVAPLMTESRQFAKLFGEPIVKSDASKKHHHHKVKYYSAHIRHLLPCQQLIKENPADLVPY